MSKTTIFDTTDTVELLHGVPVLYKDFVSKLIKEFDDPRLELCHAAMGVTGEAGELCDAIKRHAIYGKDADVGNIIEELGDLEFYMQDVRNKYNISREGILQANAEKLRKRYADLVYSDEAAIARADKLIAEHDTSVAEDTQEFKYFGTEKIQPVTPPNEPQVLFNFGLTKEQQGSN